MSAPAIPMPGITKSFVAAEDLLLHIIPGQCGIGSMVSCEIILRELRPATVIAEGRRWRITAVGAAEAFVCFVTLLDATRTQEFHGHFAARCPTPVTLVLIS